MVGVRKHGNIVRNKFFKQVTTIDAGQQPVKFYGTDIVAGWAAARNQLLRDSPMDVSELLQGIFLFIVAQNEQADAILQTLGVKPWILPVTPQKQIHLLHRQIGSHANAKKRLTVFGDCSLTPLVNGDAADTAQLGKARFGEFAVRNQLLDIQ